MPKFEDIRDSDPQNIITSIDPKSAFRPVKESTGRLHAILANKRDVILKLLTKVDVHRYIIYKTYVNSYEEQMWITGEEIIINQKPEGKVTIRSYCMKTKKWCCGYEGNTTNEFFAFCPECRKIAVFVINSDVPCDYCKRIIPANVIMDLPIIKYGCINCPANIGLDEANEDINYAKNNQFRR